MFFKRPDVRYVDMCIYIDEHMYTNDYDESLVYQYLYHIVRMLAIRRNYFDKLSVIDDFSLFAASVYYSRLTDNRQFVDGERIEPIKSILNYVKKTVYSLRGEYCRKHMLVNEICDCDIICVDSDAFSSYVSGKVDYVDRIEFGSYIKDIKTIIKEYLKYIPYEYDTPIWNNIYISCMLSFLSSVTLKNRDIKRINNFKRPNTLNDYLLNSLYLEERYNSTILYHLDDSMYNYINVLTNRIRHKLANDLSQTIHSHTPSFVNMKNLLMSNINESRE